MASSTYPNGPPKSGLSQQTGKGQSENFNYNFKKMSNNQMPMACPMPIACHLHLI